MREQPPGLRWRLGGVSRSSGARQISQDRGSASVEVDGDIVRDGRHLRLVGETRESFDDFVRRHVAGLSRLGYLLTGDHGIADDLTAETMIVAWNQWDRLQELDNPAAYLRRTMSNLAASRIRSIVRERRRIRLFNADRPDSTQGPDGAAVVDVREALLRLPPRRRACVVLRHAFDLSEEEVARVLGVSVGAVKSQASRGMAQLQGLLTVGGDDD
jgi:RNA polymerase sigma-70 factor (sigma-E family)